MGDRTPRTFWLRHLLVALLMALLPAAAGCGSSNPLGGAGISGDLKSVVVGSADFPESKIVAEIYAQALEANGFTVARQFGIGSRETYIPALRDHSIDLIPEYTGNLLQYFNPKSPATEPTDVELALHRALPGDLSMLSPASADDTDTVTVTAELAQRWGLATIEDLVPHSAEITFGAPSEFLTREQGLPGLKAKYGLDINPDNFVAISDGGGPATAKALSGGTVLAANIFSTSPAIPENGFVILEDTKNNFRAGNVVPLLNSQKMSDDIKKVLDAVSKRLSTKALTELNASVSGNSGVDPDQAAKQWVAQNAFNKPIGDK